MPTEMPWKIEIVPGYKPAELPRVPPRQKVLVGGKPLPEAEENGREAGRVWGPGLAAATPDVAWIVYPNGMRRVATAEEIQVWEYVQSLQERCRPMVGISDKKGAKR